MRRSMATSSFGSPAHGAAPGGSAGGGIGTGGPAVGGPAVGGPGAGAGAVAGAGGPAAGSGQDVVFDVTSANFEAEVLKSPVPVILDIYADWCGPCKQLTPILEQTVRAAGGTLRLAKLNSDEEPSLAQALKVTSLPTVYAIVDGKPIDQFVGVPGTDRLKEFFGKLMESVQSSQGAEVTAETYLNAASKFFSEGDFDSAARSYAAILQLLKDETANSQISGVTRARAISGMLRVMIATGDVADLPNVMKALESLGPEVCSNPEISSAIAAGNLVLKYAGEDPVGTLEAASKANDGSPDSSYALAEAQIGTGRFKEACDTLLALIASHRGWEDGKAQQLLIKICDALGSSDKQALAARRKLANLLF